MDAIISELIRMDSRAKKTIADAEKGSEEAKAAIVKEKEKIYNDLTLKSGEKLEKAKQESRQKLDIMLRELEKQFSDAENELNLQYEKNKNKWIAEITSKCIISG